jgi:hypothetical protein
MIQRSRATRRRGLWRTSSRRGWSRLRKLSRSSRLSSSLASDELVFGPGLRKGGLARTLDRFSPQGAGTSDATHTQAPTTPLGSPHHTRTSGGAPGPSPPPWPGARVSHPHLLPHTRGSARGVPETTSTDAFVPRGTKSGGTSNLAFSAKSLGRLPGLLPSVAARRRMPAAKPRRSASRSASDLQSSLDMEHSSLWSCMWSSPKSRSSSTASRITGRSQQLQSVRGWQQS